MGNEEYVKENHSYGLTTLRGKHVEICGYQLRFHFRGKSGLTHDIELTRPAAGQYRAEMPVSCRVRSCSIMSSRMGPVSRICSDDVNEYLREITGQDFTAKDFRTWVGTGQAIMHLESIGPL